jgi:hypothetical protein
MTKLIAKFTTKYGKQAVILIEHYFYAAVPIGEYAWQHNHHNFVGTAKSFLWAFIAPAISYLNPKSASNKAKIEVLIQKAVDQALSRVAPK